MVDDQRVFVPDESSFDAHANGIPALRFPAITRTERFMAPPAPLTVVRAPTGYGKTAMVAMWALQQLHEGRRVYWIHATDADAADPLRFISESLEEFGVTQTRIPADPAHTLQSRFERQIAALPADTTLVIDNYERITSPAVDFALTDVLERSGRFAIVAIAPHFATLDGPLVTSRVRTQLITVDDLAFGAGDVRALSELHGLADGAQVAQLIGLARGWPRAVQSVLAGCPSSSPSGPGLYAPAEQIARLADDYLDLVGSEASRHVLLAVALCPGAEATTIAEAFRTAPGSETPAVSERSAMRAAQRSLRELVNLGLVTQAGRPDARRYHCHPGLAAPLRARALRQLVPVQIDQLRHGHAARLGDADPIGAIALQCELSDFGSAEQLVNRHLTEVLSTENPVGKILRAVSLDELTDYPTLAAIALVSATFDPSVADDAVSDRIARLHRSVTAGLASGNASHEITNTAALLAMERMLEHHDRALELAHDLERRLGYQTTSVESITVSSVCFLHASIGFTYLLNGHRKSASRNYSRALQLAEEAGNGAAEVRARYGLALCATFEGRWFQMEELALEAHEAEQRLAQQGIRVRIFEKAPLHAVRAALHHDEMGFKRIRTALEPMAHRLEAWVIVNLAEAQLNRAVRGPHGALSVLRSRLTDPAHLFKPSPYLRTCVQVSLANMLMHLGDFAPAERQLRAIGADTDATRLATARLHLIRGDAEGACRVFDTMPIGDLSPQQLCDYLLISAVATWRIGSHEEALNDFRSAARRMAAVCGYQPLSGVPYEPLRQLAEAAGPDGAAVLTRLDELPETLQCLPYEPLSPAEARSLEALRHGEPLEQTAGRLFISPNTLKFHLRSIYRKLRVSHREEAVHRAARMGLFAPEAASVEGSLAAGGFGGGSAPMSLARPPAEA